MANKTAGFLQSFKDYFPIVSPPITLTEDLAVTFSSENKAFPMSVIDELISQWEKIDEYTELIPCFQLETYKKIYAFVYWKGSLMSHEYILVTISEDSKLLSRKVIAGTISNGKTVKRSIVKIDKENNIHAVVGESIVNEKYDPKNSKTFNFEILPSGFIEASEEENNLWE